MQHQDTAMTNWIFLSKNGNDEYINRFAKGSQGRVTNTDDFVYESRHDPIVLRGILKHKIMHRCWQDGRRFYYMDTGYFGNTPGPGNPHGWKLWHRIVPDDLQHPDIQTRPDDRWRRMNIQLQPRRHGDRIIVAAPDEKPCRFYGIDRAAWLRDTVTTLQRITKRPIEVRERAASRDQRVHHAPLSQQLISNTHAVVTFNSAAAIESILHGVPAFVMAPTHAAAPVANRDLEQIDDPYWPDQDKLHAWVSSLAYGQFHVSELDNGKAYRILNEN